MSMSWTETIEEQWFEDLYAEYKEAAIEEFTSGFYLFGDRD